MRQYKMKEYFYKKQYKYLYLGSISYNLANALIQIFGTVMLYKSGIPIWLILLIYGLRFGITGFCTPLFVTISAKFGIAKCILVSNIFNIISTYMMLNETNLYKNIIIFILVMGFMGLSNPSSDALSSKYVYTNHRGRYNSFINITKILGSAIASIFVAWGVISNNNVILFIVISIFFLLHYIFIKQIDYKPENKQNAFKESMKYIFTTKSKYKIIYALRTNHIIERQFVPLYLYIVLDDFLAFSSITVLSLILQAVIIILIGKYSDKNISKSNTLVSIIKAIITGIFLLAKDNITISFNKILNDNFEKVYETSIQTSIQNIIKESKENNELLSAIGQMSLCFTEVIVFGFLALISKFIGENIFILIFILSIISSILININIKNHTSKEN
ncbi:MAG: MFS transporter [Clostridiales bacterium]|nr:MFS transporter [Clostridiales bacterium]